MQILPAFTFVQMFKIIQLGMVNLSASFFFASETIAITAFCAHVKNKDQKNIWNQTVASYLCRPLKNGSS
jgi:hypothetical protein